MSQKYSGSQQEDTGLSQEGGLPPEKAKGTGAATVASGRMSNTALVTHLIHSFHWIIICCFIASHSVESPALSIIQVALTNTNLF